MLPSPEINDSTFSSILPPSIEPSRRLAQLTNDQCQRRAGTMPAKKDDADRRVRCTLRVSLEAIHLALSVLQQVLMKVLVVETIRGLL